jgi:hypothetical protein
MWRRRREKARARAAREDASTSGGAGTGAPGAGDSHPPGRIPVGLPGQERRAWRMDRRGPARVALTPPAEFSRRTTQDQQADMVPAPARWPANGRLGRNMASVYCIRCGQENPEGARFCSHCGNPLAPLGRGSGEGSADTTSVISAVGTDTADTEFGDEPVADAAMLDTLPAGTALLVVRRGPNAGSRFLLDSDLTLVGRHPDSDIFLDDVTVSRRHVEFYRSGSRFTVRDVGSLNGTYVNRERIEETDLTGGDEVQVGKFRLVFLLGPRSQAEHGGGGAQVGG